MYTTWNYYANITQAPGARPSTQGALIYLSQLWCGTQSSACASVYYGMAYSMVLSLSSLSHVPSLLFYSEMGCVPGGEDFPPVVAGGIST